MDLLTLLRLFRRNIVATIVSMLLAIALVGYVVVSAPPVYRSSGSVVLFSPPQPPDLSLLDDDESVPTTTVASDNPYVRFNDLSVVVDIVRRVLLSSEIEGRLREAGLVGTYTVAANIDFYRGPIIDIATETDSPQSAQASTVLVMQQLGTALDELQAEQGTDSEYRISAQSVVEPNPGTRVYSSTMRRALAVSVLGAGMVVGFVLLSDTWRRRNRRHRATGADSPLQAVADDAIDDEFYRLDVELGLVPPPAADVTDARFSSRRIRQRRPTVRDAGKRSTG